MDLGSIEGWGVKLGMENSRQGFELSASGFGL